MGEGNHYVSYNTTGNNAIMSHPSVNGSSKATYFFFFKHNAYKHIQPRISEKSKHMLSIFSSLENNCSLLFSCLKSHLEAYSEPCQTSKMKVLPKIVNGF